MANCFAFGAASAFRRVSHASGAKNDSLHDVFDAVSLQRVKLKHDQQVPEWMGEKYVGIAEQPQVQEDIVRDCEM